MRRIQHRGGLHLSRGVTGITIKITERVPVARWCGVAYTSVASQCYLFDPDGYLYATSSEQFTTATSSAATSTEANATETDAPLNSFVVFAPVVSTAGAAPADGSVPLGDSVSNASQLPAAFDFAREVALLGSPVVAVAFRADEVDDYLASGTYLTYVLGSEHDAYAALISAEGDYNLADGSLLYLDLRFPGKIYLKKK